MVKTKEDLTGKTFGRLTVIQQADDYVEPLSGTRHAQWLCECSCEEHNQVVVMQSSLKKKNPTQSCGCLQKEKMKNVLHKVNLYSEKLSDEYGDYFIGYASNTNNKFYVDSDDFDKIKDLCWIEIVNKRGYHQLTTTDDDGKTIAMHVFLGFKWHDHADRNPLNNRKHNLRLCSRQENNRNKSIRSNNTSGITGVYFDKRAKKWTAELSTGDFRFREAFNNFDDAVKARLKVENELFGPFAPQKHLYNKYEITIQN